MPTCFVTLSEDLHDLTNEQRLQLRKIVAKGLDSKSRRLDEKHIALRVIRGKRDSMLADIEIEIFAQVYLKRLFSRDKRANAISGNVSEFLNISCASWINLQMVGYSRVTPDGSEYYSDSDNKFISWIQTIKGISTKEKQHN